RHCLIGLHYVHKGILRVALDCRQGNEDHTALRRKQQPRIHKLIRKERAVVVGKSCFELDGARGVIDLVVERQQRSRSKLRLLRAIERINRQTITATQLLSNLRQVVFSNAEQNINRLQLRDYEHAVGIGGVDDVAWIDEAQTDTS